MDAILQRRGCDLLDRVTTYEPSKNPVAAWAKDPIHTPAETARIKALRRFS